MYDQLAKLLWKGAVAVAVGAAAWYADKQVKEKTGKHIHEHAAEYVKKLWSRLKKWASAYIHEHSTVEKVYISAANIAAAIKRAKDKGLKTFKMKVFAKEASVPEAHVVTEEDVDLDESDNVMEKARTDNVLAIRN